MIKHLAGDLFLNITGWPLGNEGPSTFTLVYWGFMNPHSLRVGPASWLPFYAWFFTYEQVIFKGNLGTPELHKFFSWSELRKKSLPSIHWQWKWLPNRSPKGKAFLNIDWRLREKNCAPELCWMTCARWCLEVAFFKRVFFFFIHLLVQMIFQWMRTFFCQWVFHGWWPLACEIQQMPLGKCFEDTDSRESQKIPSTGKVKSSKSGVENKKWCCCPPQN